MMTKSAQNVIELSLILSCETFVQLISHWKLQRPTGRNHLPIVLKANDFKTVPTIHHESETLCCKTQQIACGPVVFGLKSFKGFKSFTSSARCQLNSREGHQEVERVSRVSRACFKSDSNWCPAVRMSMPPQEF